MEVPQRPSFAHFITVKGDIYGASLELIEKPVYGIKFSVTKPLGYNVLVLDLNSDTAYMTEAGSLIGEWKRFTYPEQKEELLTELCNESKRRFETSVEHIKN